MKNNNQFDISKILGVLKNSDKQTRQTTAEKMISNLNNEDSKQLQEILNDKGKIDAILKSGTVQQIISKINGNNDGKLK
ncbi:MAG: hypothetical protein J6L62_07545 [Clostridia bacterium]|nr:hypothetical protein [Clostridia bacterium]